MFLEGRAIHEFGAFLVNVLKVEVVGASFKGRVTWHDACHGLRDLGVPEGRYFAPANTADCIQLKAGDCASTRRSSPSPRPRS